MRPERTITAACICVLFLLAYAHAQISYPPPDLSQYPTIAQVPALAPVQSVNTATGTVTVAVPLVQAANTTTGSGGSWAVTWSQAFATGTPFLLASPINPGGNPMVCNVTSSTSTSASGQCWTITPATLPGIALSLLNFVVNVNSATAAGVSVRVVGRDLTQ